MQDDSGTELRSGEQQTKNTSFLKLLDKLATHIHIDTIIKRLKFSHNGTLIPTHLRVHNQRPQVMRSQYIDVVIEQIPVTGIELLGFGVDRYDKIRTAHIDGRLGSELNWIGSCVEDIVVDGEFLHHVQSAVVGGKVIQARIGKRREIHWSWECDNWN